MSGAPQPRKPTATFSIALPSMTVVRGPMPTVVAGDYNLHKWTSSIVRGLTGGLPVYDIEDA